MDTTRRASENVCHVGVAKGTPRLHVGWLSKQNQKTKLQIKISHLSKKLAIYKKEKRKSWSVNTDEI